MSTSRQRRVMWACVSIYLFMACFNLLMTELEAAVSDSKAKQALPLLLVLDDLENKNTRFSGDYGKAPFDHDQHVAKDSCVTCHHTNSSKLSSAMEEPVLKCGECHQDEDRTNDIEGTNETKKFKGAKAINSKEAFHGKGSLVGCMGCHDKKKIEPFGNQCSACHTKSDTIEYQYKK